MLLEELGEGTNITITVPQNYFMYKISLVAYKSNYSREFVTTLNTSLQIDSIQDGLNP